MRTTIAGPEFTAPAGKEIEVSAEQGVELIESGYADPVHTAKETATAPVPEQTTEPKPAKRRARSKPATATGD